MAKFLPLSEFTDAESYRLMPFKLSRFSEKEHLISNDFGEWTLLSNEAVQALVNNQLVPTSKLYRELKSKHFIYSGDITLGMEILASKLRTKKDFIVGFSKLHIFCMTLRCNHSCSYCQVSRKTENADKGCYDMSDEVLERSIDIMLQSPSMSVTMEFQGGESLLALNQVKKAVLLAKEKNEHVGKEIVFVICTNLTNVTHEDLEFFKEHNVEISTSLDGHAALHNLNRPTSGGNSYEKVTRSFDMVREMYGELRLSALMTTTKESLNYPKEIIDEYVRQGLHQVFIRELNPYGFAEKAARKIGYTTDEFLQFYKKMLDYIIEINKKGIPFEECFAGLILRKLMTPWSIGFVDLQSPTGTGFNVTLYNYNGKVYPSDESRMMAETGDDTFCLGNVLTDSYEQLFFGEPMQLIASAALNEALPACSDCAYAPFCGSEPVRRLQTQGDVVGHRPTDSYCYRNKAIIQHIINLWLNGDAETKAIMLRWMRG
ncbi:His-Xaa-Ser system radical SAM maturase HxsB [Vibrio hyugaensis]|uniref:His-Xaa-Ser system radical SAM maturase HxsB n=1 Tax=Vibrio hyugaensis TaxID=1534743 RepID=UPI000CE52958|nr:His-Xaa-Ser system radical SAM maturase HxsB [Vibrio hyugaensis]